MHMGSIRLLYGCTRAVIGSVASGPVNSEYIPEITCSPTPCISYGSLRNGRELVSLGRGKSGPVGLKV